MRNSKTHQYKTANLNLLASLKRLRTDREKDKKQRNSRVKIGGNDLKGQ